MRRAALLSLLLMATVARADDLRVIKLEQDVRNLERRVQELSRQIGELKLQLALAGSQPRATPQAAPRGASWLDAGNWEQLRAGMSEADVTRILGAPTSTRAEDGTRVLFYAMEVGTEGLLGGRVTLRDGRVAEVAPPRLH